MFIELGSIREEFSGRGSIFEVEHLLLHTTKPSLIEGRYPTVGHFEGKMFSSWACEPGCYSTKPVLKWITCPTADYLSSKMPNCQYSREVVGISFDQLEVEFYVQLTLYWVRGLPLICLWSGWNRHGHIFGWQSLKETYFLGKFLAIIFVMKENYVTNQELGFKWRYYLSQDLHSDMGIMKSLFFVSIRITHKNNIKYVCAICL